MKLAAIFTDNMVLQRNKPVFIFGEYEPERDKAITVSLGKNKVTAEISGERWYAYLPEMEAQEGLNLTITSSSGEEITLNNIAVGEVWLAGGQSNMEYFISISKDAEKHMSDMRKSKVRYYNVPRCGMINEELFKAEKDSHWELSNSDTLGLWSAVGSHFAKNLSEKLGCTVGIVGCNLGGTSASVWVDEETLSSDKDTNVYLETYQKACGGLTEEEQIKIYDEYLEYEREWNERLAVIQKERPELSWEEVQKEIGECKWPGPMGIKNPYRPCGLYNTMIKRIAPFTFRGIIYYQGEEDASRCNIYYKLFTKLIHKWRKDFKDDKMPFLCVQLPMFAYENAPDDKTWPVIREAQMKASKTLENVHTAVILDCGELNNIHPVDKKPVGDRLSLLALKNVYGFDKCDAYGPSLKEIKKTSDGYELSFENSDNGFEVRGKIKGFEISYDGNNFENITPEIKESKMYIKCNSNAVEIRYQWFNYNEVTIFGKNGIPLAPFREKLR